MSYAVVFAILSLLLSGVSDIVFKIYTAEKRSRGMFLFGVGFVWTLSQFGIAQIQETPLAIDQATLVYGLMAGVFLTISNIMLLEILGHIEVSLATTIYRLNTIGVVLFSYFMLNETFGWIKGIGIFLGLIAVFFLYKSQSHQTHQNKLLLFMGIAVVASLFRAAYGVSSKVGFLEGANRDTMLIIIALSWVVGGASYAIFREKRFRMTWEKARFIMVSSILIVGIANFLMLAIQYGEASTVIPIANMSFVIALLLSVALKMEKMNMMKLGAITCAIGSILLLSQS